MIVIILYQKNYSTSTQDSQLGGMVDNGLLPSHNDDNVLLQQLHLCEACSYVSTPLNFQICRNLLTLLKDEETEAQKEKGMKDQKTEGTYARDSANKW